MIINNAQMEDVFVLEIKKGLDKLLEMYLSHRKCK